MQSYNSARSNLDSSLGRLGDLLEQQGTSAAECWNGTGIIPGVIADPYPGMVSGPMGQPGSVGPMGLPGEPGLDLSREVAELQKKIEALTEQVEFLLDQHTKKSTEEIKL